jgi:ABC-2 type transport system permease protein
VSPARILAIARRIAQGFRRDERTLGLMFVVPLVVTALLGWVLSEQVDEVVDVAIVNEAGEVGDRIVTAMQDAAAEPDSDITVAAALGMGGTPEAEAMVKDGRADLAIVIPSDLVERVLAGERPTLTVISEGTDPAAEMGRFGTLQAIMADVAGELVPPGANPPVLPQVERRTIYLSPDASQADVLAPIFLGFFGYFFVFLLTGVSFLRERIGGTLERLLATPVTRFEIVTGYSLGFGVFATIQVIALTLFILNSVDVPAIGPSEPFSIGPVDVPALGPTPAFSIGLGVAVAGSPVLAFVIALLLSLGAVNLGIFLSTFARTELQVIQFIPLVIVPQALLSGILWPTERLPDVLRTISEVLPLTYAVDGLREVMLKGSDLTSAAVQTDLVVLGGIALFFVVLASLTIKREVA